MVESVRDPDEKLFRIDKAVLVFLTQMAKIRENYDSGGLDLT